METARTILESYIFQVIKSQENINKTFHKSSKIDKFLQTFTYWEICDVGYLWF